MNTQQKKTSQWLAAPNERRRCADQNPENNKKNENKKRKKGELARFDWFSFAVESRKGFTKLNWVITRISLILYSILQSFTRFRRVRLISGSVHRKIYWTNGLPSFTGFLSRFHWLGCSLLTLIDWMSPAFIKSNSSISDSISLTCAKKRRKDNKKNGAHLRQSACPYWAILTDGFKKLGKTR